MVSGDGESEAAVNHLHCRRGGMEGGGGRRGRPMFAATFARAGLSTTSGSRYHRDGGRAPAAVRRAASARVREIHTRDNTWPRGDAPSPPTTPRDTPPPRPQPLLEPRQTCRWTKGSTNKMGNKREIHRGTAGHKGAGTPSDAHPAVPAGRRRLHRLPTQLCSRQAHPPYSTHTSPATHMRTGSASTPPGGRPPPSPHNRHQRVGSFRGRESGSRRRPHPPGPQPRRVQLGPLARPLPP